MSTAKTLQDIDKIKLVDSIIEHYPELKKERNHIINIILEKTERPEQFILERIIVNNNIYYKDIDNIIIDIDMNICGLCIINHNGFKYIISKNNNRKEEREKFLKEMDHFFQ
jgi:hypothetical protein